MAPVNHEQREYSQYKYCILEGFGEENYIDKPTFLGKVVDYLEPLHLENWTKAKVTPYENSLASKLKQGERIQLITSCLWSMLVVAPSWGVLYARNQLAKRDWRFLVLSGTLSLLSIYGTGKFAQRFFHSSTRAGTLDYIKAHLKYANMYVETQKECRKRYDESLEAHNKNPTLIPNNLKQYNISEENAIKAIPLIALHLQREKEEKAIKTRLKNEEASSTVEKRESLLRDQARSVACRAFYIAVAKNPECKGTMQEFLDNSPDNTALFYFKNRFIDPLKYSELIGKKALPIDKIVDRFVKAMGYYQEGK